MPGPVMMNTTVVAGTITGVAGAGLRLSLLLNAVACQVANSGVDIHSISKGISLFASRLKQVGQTLQMEDSVHTREALDTARQISDQAQTVFDEIEDMLDKVQEGDAYQDQKAPSVQQRFKSCFKKQRVTYLLADLESLKLSLAVMLQVLQLGRMMEMKSFSVLGPNTDELIAYERADSQNMIIVRYWSIKRLDRLYDLARKEALETEKDGATHITEPNSQFATSAPAVQHSGSPFSDAALVRLPVISLGVDTSLGAMEDSPKDMLRLTEIVLESLLARWVYISGRRRLGAPDGYHGQGADVPRPYVSSGSEDGDTGDESDGHGVQGYYLEGTTTDWRRPHSQEARQQAAHLRRKYSGIQARVESDTDDTGRSRSNDSSRPTLHVSHAQPQHQPPQTRPIPMPAPQRYNHSWSGDRTSPSTSTSPRSPKAPTGFSPTGFSPSGQAPPIPPLGRGVPNYPYHTPNTLLTPPVYTNPQMQTIPRYHPPQAHHEYSRSLPDHHHHSPQQQQPPSSPSRRRSTRSGKANSPHHEKDRDRDRDRDRHKDLKRTATRGILGASAIAGFMDALDAFSII